MLYLLLCLTLATPGIGTELAVAVHDEWLWRDPRRRRAVLDELERRRRDRD